jgi:hypothetical protein
MVRNIEEWMVSVMAETLEVYGFKVIPWKPRGLGKRYAQASCWARVNGDVQGGVTDIEDGEGSNDDLELALSKGIETMQNDDPDQGVVVDKIGWTTSLNFFGGVPGPTHPPSGR